MNLRHLKSINDEHKNAVEKHGPYFETMDKGIAALMGEVCEVMEARARGDIEGAHGVRREAAQVAAVCLKLLARLDRPKMPKALIVLPIIEMSALDTE